MPTLPEWILIVAILLIILTASRLGSIGDALGRLFLGRRADPDRDDGPRTP